MKSFFHIYKPVNPTKDVSVSVSFYVRNYPLDYNSGILQGYRTISNIKNKYCEKLFCVDEKSDDYMLSIIFDLFVNNKFDANGDAFFEKPISFKAQSNYNRSEGYGRTSTYYLVGVNFK